MRAHAVVVLARADDEELCQYLLQLVQARLAHACGSIPTMSQDLHRWPLHPDLHSYHERILLLMTHYPMTRSELYLKPDVGDSWHLPSCPGAAV